MGDQTQHTAGAPVKVTTFAVDLNRVTGIGPRTIERLRPFVIEEASRPLAEMAAENRKLRSAMYLIWAVAIERDQHLGYERRSGIGQRCIACIAAMGLGIGMGSADASDFDEELARIHAEAQLKRQADSEGVQP